MVCQARDNLGFRNRSARRQKIEGEEGGRQWFCTLASGVFSQRRKKKEKRGRRINYSSYLPGDRGKNAGLAIATALQLPSGGGGRSERLMLSC